MSFPFEIFDQSNLIPVDVKKGYSIWSEYYDDILTGNLEHPILNTFLRHISNNVGVVLDMGCGTGKTGEWLKDHFDDIVIDGVDFSIKMINVAITKKIYRDLVACDMLCTNIVSEKYDLIMNVLSACHIRDIDKLYVEAHRLLKDKGYFIVIDYHPHMLMCGKGTFFIDTNNNAIAIKNYVHLLSDHVRCAHKCKYTFVDFDESLVTEGWLGQELVMKDYVNHTIGFGYIWQK